MPSSLPSSFSRPGATGSPKPYEYTPPASPSPSPSPAPLQQQEGGSNLPLYLSLLALLVALACFYGVFFGDRAVSESQKADLRGIAQELRSLQERDITLSAPLQTTLTVDKTYPIADLFPANFELPLDFEIPLDTQLVGISSTGQPVTFRLQESLPIKANIPINSKTAFGTETIRLQKQIPVEAKFSSSVKVRAAYGQELNGIIDRLEHFTGDSKK